MAFAARISVDYNICHIEDFDSQWFFLLTTQADRVFNAVFVEIGTEFTKYGCLSLELASRPQVGTIVKFVFCFLLY
jgi:hypothetical protein